MTTRKHRRIVQALSAMTSMFLSGSLMATIHTVSNDPNRPGMFLDFPTAYAAATDNDTIFIFGSPSSGNVGGGTIDRVVHIVGNGYDPYLPGYYSRMANVTFAAGSAGATIEGVWITAGIYAGNATVTIRNCLIEGVGYNPSIRIDNGGSITAINNLIWREESACMCSDVAAIGAGTNLPNGPHFFYNNVIISNYFLQPGENRLLNNNFGNGLTNATFENNVFFSWLPTCRFSDGYSLNNAFTNNIFYNVTTVSSNCDFCAFTNNLVSGCTDCNLITGTQTGGTNLFDDPSFVNYTTGSWNFVNNDLALQPGSPGEDYGTDGKDVGLYGGPYPMVPGTVHGQLLTILPYISSFNITNPVIPETTGGPLEISTGATIVNE